MWPSVTDWRYLLPPPSPQETLYNVVGFVMLITAGIMAVQSYSRLRGSSETKDAGLAMGSLCIINAIIYLVDAFVAFRIKRSG